METRVNAQLIAVVVIVASALFFDIGVYAVVVGATLLILTALAHQSVRAHRPSNQLAPQPARQTKEGAA